MSALQPKPYLSSSGSGYQIPLQRYLPPYTPGVMSGWLRRNLEPGSWVVDPLGSSPLSILEAAGQGYRVLVACNNPVTAFLLQLLAAPPEQEELLTSLATLANQRKGEQRLEPAIQELYLTACLSCGKKTPASGFIWQRGAPYPHARYYTCPHCGDSGERTITDDDIELLQPLLRTAQLHRARARERVMRGEQVSPAAVDEALEVYTPRALHALFTLMNKVDSMEVSPRQKQLIDALLLFALDEGSSLWTWPQEDERPRQFNVPGQFIERNIWMCLERAVDAWQVQRSPIELTLFPEKPGGAGVSLFRGRMRSLKKEKLLPEIKAITSLIPRVSPAYWTLSALWTGWLWAESNPGSLSALIERQRFDWRWHTQALQAAFTPAAAVTPAGSPVFGILEEPTTGLVNAAVQAAYVSGFTVAGYAMRDTAENIQLEWSTGGASREARTVNIQKVTRDAIRETLQECGEPQEYLKLHTAVTCSLADKCAFPPSIHQLTYDKSNEIQNEINKVYADRGFLTRLDATGQDPESGLWWLEQDENVQTALGDRLESEIFNWLEEKDSIPVSEIEERLNQRFTGLLTPSRDAIWQCLESYATLDERGQNSRLRPEETRAAREKDAREMQDLLVDIAGRLKLVSEGMHPLIWKTRGKTGEAIYRIYISTHAIVDKRAMQAKGAETETILILPGSRAGLMKFKFDHNPHLRKITSGRWHFLKFRTLRAMAARQDLTLELWQAMIDSDPLSIEEETQLTIFT